MNKPARKHPPDWLLAILLIAGVYLWQRTVFPIWMVDILPLQIASWQWEHDQSEWMYSTEATAGDWYNHAKVISDSLGGEGFSNPYYYAPAIAALLSPFSEARARSWMYALFAVNTSLIFIFAWIILKISGTALRPRNFLWAMTLPLLAYPLSRATKLGQVVPILIVIAWFGILAMQRNRAKLSGLFLGIAGGIKLFPLGLIAIPAFRKQWKTVWVSIAATTGFYLLGIVFLGWPVHERWWKSIEEFGGLVNTYQGNQSLTGWFSRLTGEQSLITFVSPPNPHLELFHRFAAGVVAAVTLWIVWRHRKKQSQDIIPLSCGFLLAGVLLSIANSWEHYWLFCLPVLIFPLREMWERGKIDFYAVFVGLMSFLFLMKLTRFYDESFFGRLASGSQTMGMLMLWIWLMWKLTTQSSRAIAADGRS